MLLKATPLRSGVPDSIIYIRIIHVRHNPLLRLMAYKPIEHDSAVSHRWRLPLLGFRGENRKKLSTKAISPRISARNDFFGVFWYLMHPENREWKRAQKTYSIFSEI